MFNRGIALGAAAALALAGSMAAPAHAYTEEKRMEPAFRPRRPGRKLKKLRRYHARGSTKKCGAFRYKGSKRAKRATKRGGNPARH
jgi:hypothetical protein